MGDPYRSSDGPCPHPVIGGTVVNGAWEQRCSRCKELIPEPPEEEDVLRAEVESLREKLAAAERERDEARAMSGNLCDAAAQWRTYATEYHEGLVQANAWAARWKAAAKHFRKDAERGWEMQFAAEVLAASAEEERDAAVAQAATRLAERDVCLEFLARHEELPGVEDFLASFDLKPYPPTLVQERDAAVARAEDAELQLSRSGEYERSWRERAFAAEFREREWKMRARFWKDGAKWLRAQRNRHKSGGLYAAGRLIFAEQERDAALARAVEAEQVLGRLSRGADLSAWLTTQLSLAEQAAERSCERADRYEEALREIQQLPPASIGRAQGVAVRALDGEAK